jgi:hypothetical protein
MRGDRLWSFIFRWPIDTQFSSFTLGIRSGPLALWNLWGTVIIFWVNMLSLISLSFLMLIIFSVNHLIDLWITPRKERDISHAQVWLVVLVVHEELCSKICLVFEVVFSQRDTLDVLTHFFGRFYDWILALIHVDDCFDLTDETNSRKKAETIVNELKGIPATGE